MFWHCHTKYTKESAVTEYKQNNCLHACAVNFTQWRALLCDAPHGEPRGGTWNKISSWDVLSRLFITADAARTGIICLQPSVWLFETQLLYMRLSLIKPLESQWAVTFFNLLMANCCGLVWILMTVWTRRKCSDLTTMDDACVHVVNKSAKAVGFACHHECYISPFTADVKSWPQQKFVCLRGVKA